MIIKINNFDDERLDIYARLSEAQIMNLEEPKDSLFIAESPKVIDRALNAGYEPVSMLVETKHVDGEAKDVIFRCGDIPVFTAEYEVLVKLTGYALTRGILCAMRRKVLPDFKDLISKYDRIVVLDNIENPTNVGAIFRSAAALNGQAVVLVNGSSNPLYRRTVRVSMGTVFQIPWTIYDGNDYVDILKELGFKVLSCALKEDSVSPSVAGELCTGKVAAILGNEGDGLNDDIIRKSDSTVMIPMSNGVDSLNVAAASAVIFWELFKNKA